MRDVLRRPQRLRSPSSRATARPSEHVLRVHGPGRFIGELGPAARTGGLLHRRRPGARRGPRRVHGPAARPGVPGLRPSATWCCAPVWAAARCSSGRASASAIIGSRYSPDTRRLREFAARNRLPHRWIDLETDEEAEDAAAPLRRRPGGDAARHLAGHHPAAQPQQRRTGPAHRPAVTPPPGAVHGDLLIVGSGPAGLAAAVYAASEGLSTTVVEAMATGGQAGTSSRIENCLGFPAGISGAELTERAVLQADKFGARISVPAEATAAGAGDDGPLRGRRSPTAARSPPAPSSWPPVPATAGSRCPASNALEGTSVHYSATVYEAQQCRTDPVAVVGGGNSAGQAVLFLAGYAPQVHLLVREDPALRPTCPAT